MRAWRLCKSRWADTAFDGEGARRWGGRWNHRGQAMVYAAESLALATLELLVHADPSELPVDLAAIAVDLPDDAPARILRDTELPDGWRDHPPPAALADLGTAWLRRGEELLLLVPSAVVPQERCVLINPAHRDFARARIGAPVAFALDPRVRPR